MIQTEKLRSRLRLHRDSWVLDPERFNRERFTRNTEFSMKRAVVYLSSFSMLVLLCVNLCAISSYKETPSHRRLTAACSGVFGDAKNTETWRLIREELFKLDPAIGAVYKMMFPHIFDDTKWESLSESFPSCEITLPPWGEGKVETMLKRLKNEFSGAFQSFTHAHTIEDYEVRRTKFRRGKERPNKQETAKKKTKKKEIQCHVFDQCEEKEWKTSFHEIINDPNGIRVSGKRASMYGEGVYGSAGDNQATLIQFSEKTRGQRGIVLCAADVMGCACTDEMLNGLFDTENADFREDWLLVKPCKENKEYGNLLALLFVEFPDDEMESSKIYDALGFRNKQDVLRSYIKKKEYKRPAGGMHPKIFSVINRQRNGVIKCLKTLNQDGSALKKRYHISNHDPKQYYENIWKSLQVKPFQNEKVQFGWNSDPKLSFWGNIEKREPGLKTVTALETGYENDDGHVKMIKVTYTTNANGQDDQYFLNDKDLLNKLKNDTVRITPKRSCISDAYSGIDWNRRRYLKFANATAAKNFYDLLKI